jgi:hypothetical protein
MRWEMWEEGRWEMREERRWEMQEGLVPVPVPVLFYRGVTHWKMMS